MADADCPSTDDLKAFILGELPEARDEVLREHLETCPHCETLARELDQEEDPIIRAVRRWHDVQQGLGTGDASSIDSGPETLNTSQVGHESEPVIPVVPGYEELVRVGQGGMGTVYRAWDPRLKREVALKVLRSGNGGREQRFRIEAEAVARFRHPHIVQIHEIGQWQPAGQSGSAPYLALEYVSGGSLEQVLARGPLSPDQSAHLLEVLARAVHAAHEAGIVHRDLKPGNVLLAAPVPGNSGSLPFGFPKIADFGLARQLDVEQRLSLERQVLGTPAYMAPEQAEGKRDLGPATDVWALGVILYETLTGRRPFEGESLTTTLAQVCQAQPRPPRELRSEVPAALEAICLRCLEKDPARRYPSAAALADDLAGATGMSSPEPSPSPRRRRAVIVCLISLAVLALGLVAGGWVVWYAPWKPRPEEEPLRGELIVRVWNEARSKQGEQIGSDALAVPVREDEQLHLEAKLNQPAYIYLLWVDGKGTVTGLYPWGDEGRDWEDVQVPPPSQQPKAMVHSPGQLNQGWPIDDTVGLDTMLLLARKTPLPADVRLADLFGNVPPAPLVRNDEVVVRGLNEGTMAEEVSLDLNRRPKGQAELIDNQLLLLMHRLKDHFELIRAVRFAHVK